MKQENQLPPISNELLKALTAQFPMRDFGPSTPLREIDHHSGARSVIRFLKFKHSEQRENSLTSIPNN